MFSISDFSFDLFIYILYPSIFQCPCWSSTTCTSPHLLRYVISIIQSDLCYLCVSVWACFSTSYAILIWLVSTPFNLPFSINSGLEVTFTITLEYLTLHYVSSISHQSFLSLCVNDTLSTKREVMRHKSTHDSWLMLDYATIITYHVILNIQNRSCTVSNLRNLSSHLK